MYIASIAVLKILDVAINLPSEGGKLGFAVWSQMGEGRLKETNMRELRANYEIHDKPHADNLMKAAAQRFCDIGPLFE